jgi:hypothetical protein
MPNFHKAKVLPEGIRISLGPLLIYLEKQIRQCTQDL